MAGTTLDDVKAAGVSGSQMYQCFPDKDEFVHAAISDQAGVIAGNQRQADLGRALAVGVRAVPPLAAGRHVEAAAHRAAGPG